MNSRKLSPLKILNQQDLTRIHEASVKVLGETGMNFPDEEALEIFKKHGAKVIGKTVYLSKKMIEDALDKCPSTFKWRARNDKYSVTVGDGFLVQAVGCPVYVQEMSGARRLGVFDDFINLQKLNQSSDVVDIVGFIPMDASDLDQKTKHLRMQYEILKNTDKPIHGHVCGGKAAGEMLDMIEIAFGEKDLMKNHYVTGLSINPLSPLSFAKDELETLITYVKRNQPIFTAPLSMGGLTGPLSHMGLTVLANAECLATIVLTQLINTGNPVIMAISSVFADMREARYISGSPDNGLHQLTNIQMARDLYNLPTRVNCGASDSKIIDAQASMETTQNLMMGMLSGCNVINEALGILDGIMTVSYEKMMIDEEIIKRIKYLNREIDVSDEALSIEVIKAVGSENTYLDQLSTFKNCRDVFYPTVSHSGTYERWVEEGSKDIIERANQIYKERLEKAPETLLDSEVERDLEKYIGKIINNSRGKYNAQKIV